MKYEFEVKIKEEGKIDPIFRHREPIENLEDILGFFKYFRKWIKLEKKQQELASQTKEELK